MMNYSTVLDQTTWGVHLNFEGHFASPPGFPAWLNPLQRQDWQRRGIVVWDAELRVVTHLYAAYALEILERIQDNNAWESNGFVIGSPTFQLSSNGSETLDNETIEGIVKLKNQIELASDRAQTLLDFLTTHKILLEHISICDREDAETALGTVFRLIAAYGRKIRKGKKESYRVENPQPKAIPISIPCGKYYTVHQAALLCNATSKQIRAWIRNRKIDALDLPGLGILIEAEELHQFLYK